MKVPFRLVLTAFCGLLLGLPAVQAEEKSLNPTEVYVELDTSEDGVFRAYPRDLALQAGKLYRLELMNYSQDQVHVVMGPEFSDAIAVKSVRNYPRRTEIAGASFAKGVGLAPGARVEMYFEPQKDGRYKLFCDDRLHTTSGMEVTIVVRR